MSGYTFQARPRVRKALRQLVGHRREVYRGLDL